MKQQFTLLFSKPLRQGVEEILVRYVTNLVEDQPGREGASINLLVRNQQESKFDRPFKPVPVIRFMFVMEGDRVEVLVRELCALLIGRDEHLVLWSLSLVFEEICVLKGSADPAGTGKLRIV